MVGTRTVHRKWAVALATVSLLLVASCSTAPPELIEPTAGADGRPAGGSGSAAGPDDLPAELQEFYDQDLAWQPCGANECAQLSVPVDYHDPNSATIELELLRVRASGDPVGSLVVNPGGPGGSGVEYAGYASMVFTGRLLSSYDIVGFDPRGVASSAPVVCLEDSAMDRFIDATTGRIDQPDPDLASLIEEFVQGCQDNAGALAPHVSTVEAARDMDILRSALGEEQLDYYGASYGTFLGTTYANLYPDRVGNFVLDAGVAPTVTGLDRGLAQAEGFERATTAFVEYCVSEGDCPLGDDTDTAKAAIPELLAELSENPLPVSNDTITELNDAWAFWGIIVAMYSEDFWPILKNSLSDAIDNGRGDSLMFLANVYFSRNATGSYSDNSSQVIYAVNCLDAAASGDDSEQDLSDEQLLAAYQDASPTWGAYFIGESPCEQWPYQPQEAITDYSAPGTPPIVVIGTTRDPATPIEWSQELADLLDQGVLLTLDGDGHGAYGRGVSCVDDAVDSFLIEGTVPVEGTVC